MFLSGNVFPVFQEFFDAGIGQGVFRQLNHDGVGDGGDIGAWASRISFTSAVSIKNFMFSSG